MIIEAIIFLITFVVGYYLYRYIKLIKIFKERGVKFLPGVPVFGNILGSTMAKRHIVEDIDQVYKSFPDQKYVGYVEGTTPILLIRDPELIKNITVKDFDHFVDHKEFFSESIDPLFGSSLIQMKGERWRDMRTTLSPAFTGSKMRLMMPFMAETTKNVMDYLKDHTSEELNFGDLMHRYTNDVIASAAFGLQCNSVQDPDNEFYKLGQKLFVFTPWQRVVFFLSSEFPRLAKLLGLKLFNQKTHDFFRNIVVDTMKFRQENNVERPDMIQLLMEASKGTLKNTDNGVGKEDVGFATAEEVLKAGASTREWTQTDLISQVFIFFVAGFESSANGLVMAFHELALNPEVQDKLYQEMKAFEENNTGLVYETIGKLKYLDCVLNETLRKWSPALVMDRTCNKPYVLPPPVEGGNPYRINRGEIVYNMVNCIQMDPQYYPHPEKFDPDRFSDDNKHNIQPFTFMPFGMGPRNCIGSRFALLELKVLLYNVILKYKVVKSPKTTDPIMLDPTNFTIGVKGGTWVILEPRN